MQCKILAFVTSIALAAPSWSQGQREDLQEIYRLTRAGEYAKALEAH